jgi:hypothetical protein
MIINRDANGSMSEWLKEADCKSAGYAYVGSNPTRPTKFNPLNKANFTNVELALFF